jgi:RNA polymerase sigma-70 factor, ECF subfamily
MQAAISAVHAAAGSVESTDWPAIIELYDALLRLQPSSVVELNRAVAIAMRDGPSAGLAIVDWLLDRGGLGSYHPAHATRAELCHRLGRHADARASWQRALPLTRQAAERRFIERRLAALTD